MPDSTGVPPGTLVMLALRVMQSGPLHGYAIAQKIHALSSDVLQIEEGSLYPALQKILLKGWAVAEWGVSETNRKVKFYSLTRAGTKQLHVEVANWEQASALVARFLDAKA